MMNKKTIHQIQEEIEAAKQAAAVGNEGMARVCARRAAGWAIQIHLHQQGIDLNTPSAFEYIKYYGQLEEISEEHKKILSYLQTRVEKESLDADSFWPLPDIDLVEQAENFVKQLISLK